MTQDTHTDSTAASALHSFFYINPWEFSLFQVHYSSNTTHRTTRLSNTIHHQHRNELAHTQTPTSTPLHNPQTLTRRTEISRCTPYTTWYTHTGDGRAAKIQVSILIWSLIAQVDIGACSAGIQDVKIASWSLTIDGRCVDMWEYQESGYEGLEKEGMEGRHPIDDWNTFCRSASCVEWDVPAPSLASLRILYAFC